ncbi:unnamed protein product [Polarella glacialis]|uniref:Uncharacterized protein n=1 Tax=Polarella glacialis TaxID=89957 RepID=A0A813KVQ9_POLGL|nr:unnamed protein product [Polarella glacialis]
MPPSSGGGDAAIQVMVMPSSSANHVQSPAGEGALGKGERVLTSVCVVHIGDLIEDGVRVRMLNVWAFALMYVFFVLSLLESIPSPGVVVSDIQFANPPPSFYFAGKFNRDLYEDKVPKRLLSVYVRGDDGAPMRGVTAQTEIDGLTSNGPLPCSDAARAEMARTLELLRTEVVCSASIEATGNSTSLGVAWTTNMIVDGPTGVYTLSAAANGVKSAHRAKIFVTTPVASLTVVDASQSGRPRLYAPQNATVGQALALQPSVLVLDSDGLPIPGRQVRAFANPDPTWPPKGPMASPPPGYSRRGQKLVELNCAVSEPSDEQGLARFTCLGVKSATVNHVFFVFSESAFTFTPWNDPTYSSLNLMTVAFVAKYRYPTAIVARVAKVEVVQKPSLPVTEGVPLYPQPLLMVTDSNGQPVPDVACYALTALYGGAKLPLHFRRKGKGQIGKQLLDATATTGQDGVARFQNLTLSVYGNVYPKDMVDLGIVDPSFAISFVCDGIEQAISPWGPASGGYISRVNTTIAAVKIMRFIKASAELSAYYAEPTIDGSELFTAVVRVLDQNGKGIAGKTVSVEPADAAAMIGVAVAEDVLEPTNNMGFAVVPFRLFVGAESMINDGSQKFQVKFLADEVRSEESQVLMGLVEGVVTPTKCQYVLTLGFTVVNIAKVTSGGVDAPGAVTEYTMGQVPTIGSGDLVLIKNFLIGQTLKTCVHFPELLDPGVLPNLTLCEAIFGRRLQEADEEGAHHASVRRLSEVDHHTIASASRGRRLASADGSLGLQFESAYSTDKDKWGNTEYQPKPLLASQVVTDERFALPLPTLKALSAKPDAGYVVFQVSGPPGHHFVRLKADINVPAKPGELATEQNCYSMPLPIIVRNDIGDIIVEGDLGAAALYDKEVEATQPVDITLTFLPPDTGDPIPTCLHMNETWWALCAVKWRLVEAPYNYHGMLGMTTEDLASLPLSTDYYEMAEVAGPNGTVGFDASTNKMHLQLRFKKAGIFGNFAIQFFSSGARSRVFTWRVNPPPGLSITVLQEPAGEASGINIVGNFLPVRPRIQVLSNGQPVDGAVVRVEQVYDTEKAAFSRLTAIDGYSPLPFVYSGPSGMSGDLTPDGTILPVSPGVAEFGLFALLDGSGCTQFQFHLGELSTQVVPAIPICFTPAWEYKIVQMPPSTLPLNTRLSDVSGAKFVVEMSAPNGSPEFLNFGFAAVRVMVSSLAKVLSYEEAWATTSTMLDESVCVWINFKEVDGACSLLEVVQTAPYVILRFSFLNLAWSRVVSLPAQAKLLISDLSASALKIKMDAPAGFAQMGPLEKYSTCMSAVRITTSKLSLQNTREIKAELTPAGASTSVAPPDVVTVGSMFLVRIQLRTASGAPLAGQSIRVGIVKVSSTKASSASGGLLQRLSQQGHTLAVSASHKVTLDDQGLVRTSKADGTVSFPLTVSRASSGTYMLQFQPEAASSKILYESQTFKVTNQIEVIGNAEDPWTEISILKFGEAVDVPRRPAFKVTTTDGSTLQQLHEDGTKILLKLELKGTSTKQTKANSIVNQVKQDAVRRAKAGAKSASSKLVKTLGGVAQTAASRLMAQKFGAAVGAFAMLDESFAVSCSETAANALQDVDEVQESTMAEAVSVASDVIDPGAMAGQFMAVVTGGGNEMKNSNDMKVKGTWDLSISDLELISGTSDQYVVKTNLKFPFALNTEYSFTLSINGVTAKSGFTAFKVKLEDPPAVDVFLTWFCTAMAGILASVLLATNTTQHHWMWLCFSTLCTIGLMIALPYLNLYKDAIWGAWQYIAFGNLALILFSLLWAIMTEKGPKCAKTVTFEQKKLEIFAKYTRNAVLNVMKIKGSEELSQVKPSRCKLVIRNLRSTFTRGFEETEAFFFPSNLLIATFLSTMSFFWILSKTVQIQLDIEKALQGLLNKAIESSVKLTASMNNAFFQAVGADLPDTATGFMYKQLDLVESWFTQLIAAITRGFLVGTILASIFTAAALVLLWVDFRQKTMDARKGKFAFKLEYAQVQYSAGFIGILISSTVISFVLIVLVVVLATIPLSWPLLWNMIWDMKEWIIYAFLLPKVAHILITLIFKKCLFTDTLIRNRGAASIYFFLMTWLSLIAGVAGALVRFVMGLVGLLAMLPIAFGANTPELINQIYLLDATYKNYIATVLTHCNHNNPIMITAAQRMLHIVAVKMAVLEGGRKWTSSRRLVILILMRFPELRKFRKHALEVERELAEASRALGRTEKKEGVVVDCDAVVAGKVQKPQEQAWIQTEVLRMHTAVGEMQKQLDLLKRYRSILAGAKESGERAEIEGKIRRLLSNQRQQALLDSRLSTTTVDSSL